MKTLDYSFSEMADMDFKSRWSRKRVFEQIVANPGSCTNRIRGNCSQKYRMGNIAPTTSPSLTLTKGASTDSPRRTIKSSVHWMDTKEMSIKSLVPSKSFSHGCPCIGWQTDKARRS